MQFYILACVLCSVCLGIDPYSASIVQKFLGLQDNQAASIATGRSDFPLVPAPDNSWRYLSDAEFMDRLVMDAKTIRNNVPLNALRTRFSSLANPILVFRYTSDPNDILPIIPVLSSVFHLRPAQFTPQRTIRQEYAILSSRHLVMELLQYLARRQQSNDQFQVFCASAIASELAFVMEGDRSQANRGFLQSVRPSVQILIDSNDEMDPIAIAGDLLRILQYLNVQPSGRFGERVADAKPRFDELYLGNTMLRELYVLLDSKNFHQMRAQIQESVEKVADMGMRLQKFEATLLLENSESNAWIEIMKQNTDLISEFRESMRTLEGSLESGFLKLQEDGLESLHLDAINYALVAWFARHEAYFNTAITFIDTNDDKQSSIYLIRSFRLMTESATVLSRT